jgi:bacterioferritin-associated ferredoxin
MLVLQGVTDLVIKRLVLQGVTDLVIKRLVLQGVTDLVIKRSVLQGVTDTFLGWYVGTSILEEMAGLNFTVVLDGYLINISLTLTTEF